MSNVTINMKAHKNLTDKFGLKLLFSLLWREILMQWVPMLVAVVLVTILSQSLGNDLQLVLAMTSALLVYLVFLLLTNQYITNSLSLIKYKDFSVYLVKDNQVVSKMGFYDSLCWKGSRFWREVCLGFAYGAIAFGIEEFQLLSESMVKSIDRGAMIAIYMVAFIWLLKRKNKGRFVIIQAKAKHKD